MANLTGIQNVKDKIKKLTFEDRNEAFLLNSAKETVEISKVKTVKRQTDKNINSFNVKNLERRKASKNQITAYLLDEELEMLEELYFQKRKKKIKTDRSSIIGEAIKTFYLQTVKK